MEREQPLSIEQEAKLILDSHPLNQKVRDWALDTYHHGYFKFKEISNPDFLSSKYQTFLVAMHEMGHAAVVRALGWRVNLISVIPNGRVLGFTSYSIGANSLEGNLTGQIAASYGGEAGEDLANHLDHRGCGSDFSKASFFERALHRIGKNTSSSRSFARSVVFSQSSHIKSQALTLMQKGVA